MVLETFAARRFSCGSVTWRKLNVISLLIRLFFHERKEMIDENKNQATVNALVATSKRRLNVISGAGTANSMIDREFRRRVIAHLNRCMVLSQARRDANDATTSRLAKLHIPEENKRKEEEVNGEENVNAPYIFRRLVNACLNLETVNM